jgi:hypothetical protein
MHLVPYLSLLIAAGTIAACVASPAPPAAFPTGSATEAFGSPSPTAATADVGDPAWGPLAVIDEEAQAISASWGGVGPLTIGDECVTHTRVDSGKTVTLVWRDSQTTWQPPGRILFDDPLAGATRDLSDGVVVDIGGTGAVRAPWIVRPARGCPREVFVVHSLDIAGE